ncbi:MAG TPA: carbon-nitrogen hydrolase family protein [Nocardioidaceae bacterium]|nr:carbon-nitrogen hydrolase family protein [Nocardioidaceae bacterium]
MSGFGLAPLTIAAAQADSVAGDVARNAETASELVREGAAAGARVVVLPELFLPGYDMATLAADPDGCDVVDPMDDPRLEPIRSACAAAGTVGIVGASVRSGPRRTIGVLVIDGDGGVRHAYDKQHLLSTEAEIFEPGRDRAILTVDGWPLGLAVCYDGCFPEHARSLADDDALIYVAPAAYVVGSEHRRDVYYAARALDNGCYVVFADLMGPCGAGAFSGGSAIYDPEGQPLVRAGVGREVVTATLDADRLGQIRRDHGMGADHRESLGPVRRLAV